MTIDGYCQMHKDLSRADKSLKTFNQLFREVVEDKE